MAQLSYIIARSNGAKDIEVEDFLITRAPDQRRRSIDDLSVDEINRIAGVA